MRQGQLEEHVTYLVCEVELNKRKKKGMSNFTFDNEKHLLKLVICEGRQFSVICHVEAVLERFPNQYTSTFCTRPTQTPTSFSTWYKEG